MKKWIKIQNEEIEKINTKNSNIKNDIMKIKKLKTAWSKKCEKIKWNMVNVFKYDNLKLKIESKQTQPGQLRSIKNFTLYK